MKVLVIDDSELARAQIRELLTAAGMEVFEQPSAIGATVTILRNAIDVAVVDVNMPGLSGTRLVQLLRGNPRLKQLQLVLISGRSWTELKAIGGASGADALLPKDRVTTDLVEILRRLHTSRLPDRSLRA